MATDTANQPLAPARAARADLHCHTRASSGPAAAVLGHIGCPECYSPPEKVFEQAMARGMDLVAITDHDTIDGAMELIHRGFERVIVGEEVTVHFPEDRCKLHVLVWGLTPEQHEDIARLKLRDNVYSFARWLRYENLPHALAHPLYVQNGKLSPWHVERCAVLFKCFETLNGAHSGAHRAALDRFLDQLTPGRLLDLVNRHGLEPLWPRAWEKGRTGGSDDHGLLNVGRTWTAVEVGSAAERHDPQLFLRRVMQGQCSPGGAGGHATLLAHQLATVGAHYIASTAGPKLRPRARLAASRALRFAGVHLPGPSVPALVVDTIRSKLSRRRPSPMPLVGAVIRAVGPVLERHPAIRSRLDPAAWDDGPATSLHEEMADFAGDLAASVALALSAGAVGAARARDRSGVTDHLVSYAALLAAQTPYIFSLFHQNKERAFLRRFEQTMPETRTDRPVRVCLFTDTLGDVNGVSRFIRNVADEALARGRDLRVLTSTRFEIPRQENILNFEPVFAGKMPKYENLELVLPPALRMLRHIDGVRPDVIHISTPGPVGAVGFVAAKMLRVPIVGTYHTDFPAYIDRLFEDPSFTYLTSRFMSLFYRPFAAVFSRSGEYAESLAKLGVARTRIVRLQPGIDTDAFHTRFRDPAVWERLGMAGMGPKVLYCGRVSVEKNLPFLTKVWKLAAREWERGAGQGGDAAPRLIVVGDGPYREEMERELAGMNAHFLGFRHGHELSAIYASSDLFVFPSTTDTLGQVVMESQSSGLPVIVTDQGGPKEVVEEGRTGFVLGAEDARAWAGAILRLVDDAGLRAGMGAAAHEAMRPMSIGRSFEHYWSVHEHAAAGVAEHDEGAAGLQGSPDIGGRSTRAAGVVEA